MGDSECGIRNAEFGIEMAEAKCVMRHWISAPIFVASVKQTYSRCVQKCQFPDKPRPQPQARGSLQLPRHTHTVPEHGKGEMPKLKAHFPTATPHPRKPQAQPQARGSLQLPRHTHTVPEHGKGEMPKLKAHFRPQLHLIRASRKHNPKQGAVFNCPGTSNLFRSTLKGRCPRGVTPLGCSLVLSLREKEQ